MEFSAAHPPPAGVRREESFGVNKAHAKKKLGLLPWQRQVRIWHYGARLLFVTGSNFLTHAIYGSVTDSLNNFFLSSS